MTEAADIARVREWRPALPTVAEFGAWVRLVMSRLAPGDSLQSAMACSMLVVSYARALARASGRDEQASLLEAAEVFRQHLGTCEAAEQALGMVGVDVAEVAQSLAEVRKEPLGVLVALVEEPPDARLIAAAPQLLRALCAAASDDDAIAKAEGRK